MAQAFDRDARSATGAAVAVPLDVGVDYPENAAPSPQLEVALDGTLVYVPVEPGSLKSSTLVWVDRHGAVVDAGTLPFATPHFSMSPSGDRIAVTGREAGVEHIDLFDLARRTSERWLDPEKNDSAYPFAPLFSNDGSRLFFHGRYDFKQSELLMRPVDQSAPAEYAVTQPVGGIIPASAHRDGHTLALVVWDGKAMSLAILDLNASAAARVRPFSTREGYKVLPAFSPDGNWLAYVEGDKSGSYDVYVVRYPQGDTRTRVSKAGGTGPLWSKNGDALYFQSLDGTTLSEVAVRTTGGFSVSEPHALFDGSYQPSSTAGLTYALGRDGRFLMTRQHDVFPLRSSELIVVQHWFDEVRRLTGAK
jgi:Tol biopolymer transport system component